MKDMVNADTWITIDQWYNHPLDTLYIGISTKHTNVYQTSYHLEHMKKFISQHIVATTCHTVSTKKQMNQANARRHQQHISGTKVVLYTL